MVFLLLCTSVLSLNALVLLHLHSRRRSVDQAVRVPPSLKRLPEPDLKIHPHEWRHEYVPIAKASISTLRGKPWVRYKEVVPMPQPHLDLRPKALRRHQIYLN